MKAAIRYLRAKAGQYHLDGQVGLWGESAGGQLAALAGATCGVLPLEGSEGVTRESSCVQAVVDGMGPTDFLQMDTHLLNSSALHHEPATSPESQYLGCTSGLLACDDVTFYTPHGQGHTLFLTGALNPPYPPETVQSSHGCSSPVTSTNGPSLTWDPPATFFHAHLH